MLRPLNRTYLIPEPHRAAPVLATGSAIAKLVKELISQLVPVICETVTKQVSAALDRFLMLKPAAVAAISSSSSSQIATSSAGIVDRMDSLPRDADPAPCEEPSANNGKRTDSVH